LVNFTVYFISSLLFQWGNPREGDHFKDLDVDGRIILKRIFERLDGET
jgi:hypothetical protein